MNERQQRAYAAIMAQIAMLPWQERAEVFKAVEFRNSAAIVRTTNEPPTTTTPLGG
jgi:hypothetical protein